ncbi:MAG: coenzyme F420-0:L-glutamate ligase [bacterium]
MLWLILFSLILFILLLPAIGAIFLYFFRKNSLLVVELSNVYPVANKALLLEFEVKNLGSFHSIILNIDLNLLPPISFKHKKILESNSNYFDTVILKSNKAKVFRFLYEFDGSIPVDQIISNSNLSVGIILTYYDLKPIRFMYREFNLARYLRNKIDSLSENEFTFNDSLANKSIDIIAKQDVFCLKTPIITHFHTIQDLVNLILQGITRVEKSNLKKLIVCISESVIAIIQKRTRCVYDIEPSEIAQLFNHYFDQDSSLSSPYGLEMVLRDIGFARFYFSLYPGIIGKLLGISGMFYVFAGRKAAAVDDAGGTIRPYDKYVVLAPENTNQTAKQIKQKLIESLNSDIDLEVCIVDANDLGKVDILGTTSFDTNQIVINKIKTNPQGNDDQQTPVVFIPIYQ